MVDSNKINILRELISYNKAESAFEELFRLLPPSNKEYKNQYILLFADYNELRRAINLGIIDSSEISIRKNKIYSRFLSLVDELEDLGDFFEHEPKRNNTSNITEIEIRINREFSEFGESDKNQFLFAIQQLLSIEGKNLKIVKILEGSVRLFLETEDIIVVKLINILGAIKIINFEIHSIYFHSIQFVFNNNKSNHIEKLLRDANASRLTKTEDEVESNYRQILIMDHAYSEFSIYAVLNLGSYFLDRGSINKSLKLLEEFFDYFKDNPKFIKSYSDYLWLSRSPENRYKSIFILKGFCERRLLSKGEVNMELSWKLVIYDSFLTIEDWFDLNEQKKANAISLLEYDRKRSNQVNKLNELHKQGMGLYNIVINYNLDSLAKEIRQVMWNGIDRLLDICLRLKKYENGVEVCDYAIKNVSGSLKRRYEKIKEGFLKIQSGDLKVNLFEYGLMREFDEGNEI